MNLLLALALLSPADACDVAAGDLARECRRVCTRESHCTRIGLHKRDQWAARSMYRNAVRAGIVAEWCPVNVREWGVRGPWGRSAAYAARVVAPCFPPQILDIPIIGAWVWKRQQDWRCEHKGACTRKQRRAMDAGLQAWKRRQM